MSWALGITPGQAIRKREAAGVSVGSKHFIKNAHSEHVRVGRGLMKGKIKGSGWLEVNK